MRHCNLFASAVNIPPDPDMETVTSTRCQNLPADVQGMYALFASAEEAYLCRDDTYAWFSRKMGSKEKGMRLRRGYEQPRPVRCFE